MILTNINFNYFERFSSFESEKHDLYNQETIADVDFLPNINFKRNHDNHYEINNDNNILNNSVYDNNVSNVNMTDILIK